MRFQRVAILDWSAAKGPRLGRDSIWLSCAEQQTCAAENLPTRQEAETRLSSLITDCLSTQKRLLLGADFAFGAPVGFIARITQSAEALSWWAWLAARVTDTGKNISNYRYIAAEMNSRFTEAGPFWGNGEKLQIEGLPRLRPPLPAGLSMHRKTDLAARGPGSQPKPIWQLAGAGAVGAQVLTGLPVLERLRQRFPDQISVWPFDPPDRPIVFAEVYPSLLSQAVSDHCRATGMVTDEAQVRLLATALNRRDSVALSQMLAIPADVQEEGWILGAGHADVLRQSLA